MSLGMMAEHMGWGIIAEGWRKGPWTAEEDRLLIEYVKLHGEGRWNNVARLAGLKRNGKSCRLRWVNYLRPDLKRGQITPHEESIILELHARWGNRWSTIARSLPGRTDNEIKNYWRTHFKKKTKPSSVETAEKSRARLLRKQQFQIQQQRQQEQHQKDQIDMKKIMSLLGNGNDENKNIIPINFQTHPQVVVKQDMTCYNNANSNGSEEELQGVVQYNMMMHGCGNYFGSEVNLNTINNNHEDFVWDGLWNLDDFNGNCVWAANKPNGQHVFATTAFY